jgi:hypothetical protein
MITVPAGAEDPTESTFPEEGVDYTLLATGVANAGASFDFDAKWVSIDVWNTWTDDVPGHEVKGPELLQLHVDGVCVDWGTYNSGHEYYHSYTGTADPLELWIYDVYYPNNVGELVVYII